MKQIGILASVVVALFLGLFFAAWKLNRPPQVPDQAKPEELVELYIWELRNNADQQETLSKLAKLGPAASPAIPTLLKLLKKKPKLANSILPVLGSIGPKAVHTIPDIYTAVKSDEDDYELYDSSTEAVAPMGPGAIPYVRTMLFSGDKDSRRWANLVLANLGKDSLPLLREAMQNPDLKSFVQMTYWRLEEERQKKLESLREALSSNGASSALKYLNFESDFRDPSLVPLIRRVFVQNEYQREDALRAWALLAPDDPECMKAATTYLAKNPKAASALLMLKPQPKWLGDVIVGRAFSKDAMAEQRKRGWHPHAYHLPELRPFPAKKILSKYGGSEQQRLLVAGAMSKHHPRGNLKPPEAVLQDCSNQSQRIRWAACMLCLRLKTLTPEVSKELIKALQSPKYRRFARERLSQLEAPASMELIEAAGAALPQLEYGSEDILSFLRYQGDKATPVLLKGWMQLLKTDKHSHNDLAVLGRDALPIVPELARRAEEGDAVATRILGQLGPVAVQAIPALEKRTQAPTNCVESLKAIRKIKGRKSLEVLLQVLEQEKIPKEMMTTALQLIGALGSDAKSAAPQIVRLIRADHKNGQLMDLGCAALREMGAAPGLEAFLTDQSLSTDDKIAIYATLVTVSPANEEAVLALAQLLSSAKQLRFPGHIAALEKARCCEAAVLKCLTQLTDSNNYTARLAATRCLCERDGKRAEDWVIKQLRHDRELLGSIFHLDNYHDMIYALNRSPKLAKLIREQLTADNYHVARDGYKLAKHCSSLDPALIPVFMRDLNHVTNRHRTEAIEALGNVGPAAAQAAGPRIQHLFPASKPWKVSLALYRMGIERKKQVSVLTEEVKRLPYQEELIQAVGELGPAAKASIPELRKIRKRTIYLKIQAAVDEAIRKIEAAGK